MLRTRARARIAAFALLVLAVASCDGEEQAGNLPQGDALVSRAAAEMRAVRTAHFTVRADGNVAKVPLRSAEGQLTREGDAQGSLQIDQSGSLVEIAFVLVGETAYIKGATGGYQKVPLSIAAAVYDPSAILDPDRGAAKLLATARDARTEARESVDGQDAYRVKATFDQEALGALLPGIDRDVTGTVWLGVDRPVLVKAQFPVPAPDGGAGGTVTVTFSDFDAPARITPPAG
jgi:lipoprotein LprG